MTESPPYTLAADEKAFPVVVYMRDAMARGDMVIKESIRTITWFRSAAPSDYLKLHRTQVLFLSGGTPHAASFQEFLIPSIDIIAAHLIPPAQEPLDYDASEPNRKMQPITALFGSFRINAKMRMSAATNLAVYLSTAKETFMTLYDAEASNPLIPNMGTIRTPMLTLRPAATCFASRI